MKVLRICGICRSWSSQNGCLIRHRTRRETVDAGCLGHRGVGVTVMELFEFGHDESGDRERRRAIEQIVGMLADSDDTTLQAVADMIRIMLRLREHPRGERP